MKNSTISCFLIFVFSVMFLQGNTLPLQAQKLKGTFTPASDNITRSFEQENSLGQLSSESRVAIDFNALAQGLTIASADKKRGYVVFFEEVNITDNAPFVMCGITLKLSAGEADNVHVFVRPRKERSASIGALWETWQMLPFDSHSEDANEHNSPDSNADRTFGELTLRTHVAVLPAETRFVEVRVELSRTQAHQSPVLKNYRCLLHNPGKTTEEMKSQMQVNMRQMQQKTAKIEKGSSALNNSTFPRPAFVTRTDWGCPWGQTSGPNTLTSTEPTHLIVHHSFSPGNNITDWPAAVRGIWTFHVNSNGWSDVGYNWLIDPNGVIFQGRAWVGDNDNTQGAHFCGFNRATMGVCMLGDFNSIVPTEAAQRSLVRLLAYRASASRIDPKSISFHANSSRNLNTISGHRDGCATDCPGNMQYPLLANYRNRVFALLNPPTISQQSAVVLSRQSAEVSARINPNGSQTDVFVEWRSLLSSNSQFTNRRLVRSFSAQDTAATVSATLTDLNPSLYLYRFLAQNSDTNTASQPETLALTGTSVSRAEDIAALNFRIAPNPVLGAQAHISFYLQQPSFVRLTLRDVRGAVISQIFEKQMSAGENNFTFCDEKITSGTYFCYLETFGTMQNMTVARPVIVVR